MGVRGPTQEALEAARLKRSRRPAIEDGTSREPIPARRDQGCGPKTGSRANLARIKLALGERAMICAGGISQNLLKVLQEDSGEVLEGLPARH